MSKSTKNSTKSGSRPGTGQNQSKKTLSTSKSSGKKVVTTMNRGSQPQRSVASAYASGQVGRAPMISQTNDKCRVVHRELIASVTGSVAFQVLQTFALNPGLAATFPWLSTMAQSWEQYRFNKLKFCYYTRTGSNTPGSMMMAPDYDPADGSPASEQIASSFEDVAEDAPWKDITCVLPASRLNGSMPRRFVRAAALANNLDIKTYDSGQLFICAVDGTAVSWGKLWVEYDVEFFIPQLPSAGTLPQGGLMTGAASQTGANPFGNSPTTDPQSQGVSMQGSTLTIALPGTYIVDCRYVGTVITGVTNPVVNGVTVLNTTNIFDSGALNAQQINTVVTTTANANLTFALTATTITSAICVVGQAPPNSLS